MVCWNIGLKVLSGLINLSRTAGKVPGEGWKCICVCGFHELNREGKNEGVNAK